MSGTEPTPDKATRGALTPSDGAGAHGCHLWARLLLLVSLAANLLVIGIILGALIGRDGGDRRHGPPRDLASTVYLRALPDDQRAAFEDALAESRAERATRRAKIAAELAATLDVLRTEPFVPARLTERIAHQRGAIADRSNIGDQLFVERIAAMTAAQRQDYADALERMLRRVGRERGE
jgi:uncharacterized membrane protein